VGKCMNHEGCDSFSFAGESCPVCAELEALRQEAQRLTDKIVELESGARKRVRFETCEPGYLHIQHAEAKIMALDLPTDVRMKVFDALRELNDEERVFRGRCPLTNQLDLAEGRVRQSDQPEKESCPAKRPVSPAPSPAPPPTVPGAGDAPPAEEPATSSSP
jgi:hypothetical protein